MIAAKLVMFGVFGILTPSHAELAAWIQKQPPVFGIYPSSNNN
jgi:hypothetical protein